MGGEGHEGEGNYTFFLTVHRVKGQVLQMDIALSILKHCSSSVKCYS